MSRDVIFGLKLIGLSLTVFLVSHFRFVQFFTVVAFEGPAIFAQTQARILRHDLAYKVSLFRNIPLFSQKIAALESENLSLQAELFALREVEFELKAVKEELGFLKNLDNFSPELVEARVGGDFIYPNGEHFFYVDKGTLSGIGVGNLVVSKNYLIGKIVEADLKKSKAFFLLSSNFSASCFDQSATSRAPGVCRATLGSSLTFDNLNPGEEIALGDIVSTSGRDGNYPSNLIVGQITKIEGVASDLGRVAYLEPFYQRPPEIVFIMP